MVFTEIKISIVIPCYNSANSIVRAAISCIEQSVLPHEVILVNDASSDGTLELLYSLKSQYPELIKVITYEKNKGVSYARNIGWNNADGDYIAFLDSDDSFHREKIQILQGYIEMYGFGVYWHPYIFAHKAEILKEDYTGKPLSPVSLTTFSSLLIKNPVSTCTLIVPKALQKRFDENMRYCEDHDFVLRSAFNESLIRIPLMLTEKDKTETGLSSQLWKMRKGEMYMYSKLYRLHFMFLFLQPLLILFSLGKHLKLLINRK